MEKWFPLQFTFIALYRPVYSIIRIRTVWKRFLYPLLLLSFYSVYFSLPNKCAYHFKREAFTTNIQRIVLPSRIVWMQQMFMMAQWISNKKKQQQHKIHTIIIIRQWDRYYTGERPTITLCARFSFVTARKVVKAQLIGHNSTNHVQKKWTTTKNVSIVSNRWWMHTYDIAFNSMMVFYVKYHKHTRSIHTYMMRCTKRET